MAKTFIVDACLAGDAGSKDPPPERGRLVRVFLTALLDQRHPVAFTSDLEAEWKRHAALFSRRWLATMRSRRFVRRITVESNIKLRDRALLVASNAKAEDAIEKDWHLIDAALATDRTISSSDKKARSYYAAAAIKVAALKAIVWVNPATNDLAGWITGGARADKNKRLG